MRSRALWCTLIVLSLASLEAAQQGRIRQGRMSVGGLVELVTNEGSVGPDSLNFDSTVLGGFATNGSFGRPYWRLYEVTTLADNETAPVLLGTRGATQVYGCSLRACLAARAGCVDTPQTCGGYITFAVSGTIWLSRDILIAAPYQVIAGHTAPSPGITLRGGGLRVYTHDVWVSHIRIRPGGLTCNNGIEVWNETAKNVVFKNVSVSWSQDENVVFSNETPIGNTSKTLEATFYQSISAESLHQPYVPDDDDADSIDDNCSGGTDESHGLMVYDGTKNVSILRSLLHSNVERNAYMKGGTWTAFINNIVSNFDHGTLYYDADGRKEAIRGTLVGNVYRPGPSTPPSDFMSAARFNVSGSQVYRFDNLRDTPSGKTLTEWTYQDGIDPTVGVAPVTVPGYTPLSAADTWTTILGNVGAWPRARDAVDTRYISEVLARGGAFITDPATVGGWPTLPANTHNTFAWIPVDPLSVDPTDPIGRTKLETASLKCQTFVETGVGIGVCPAP